jgi:hypothetical protein
MGLAALIAASRRRLVAVLLCAALLGFVGTINRLADASEEPTFCGSVINSTIYETRPDMNDACDEQLNSHRAQAAATAAATAALLVSAAVCAQRGRREDADRRAGL